MNDGDALRLVREMQAMGGGPIQWRMLDTVAKRLGWTFERAEEAAKFAATSEWIKYEMYSVVLTAGAPPATAKKPRP